VVSPGLLTLYHTVDGAEPLGDSNSELPLARCEVRQLSVTSGWVCRSTYTFTRAVCCGKHRRWSLPLGWRQVVTEKAKRKDMVGGAFRVTFNVSSFRLFSAFRSIYVHVGKFRDPPEAVDLRSACCVQVEALAYAQGKQPVGADGLIFGFRQVRLKRLLDESPRLQFTSECQRF
jgi:hypothetical protein